MMNKQLMRQIKDMQTKLAIFPRRVIVSFFALVVLAPL